MEEIKNELGLFATPIETLAEVKSARDIIADPNDSIENHFTKVSCSMKRIQFKGKDGTLSEPRYQLSVYLHPTIREEMNNKKMINEVEYTLLCYEFLKPIETPEINFNGWVRFLRGSSEAVSSEDKTFTVVELFISKNMSTVQSFLNNSTKLLIERLTAMDAQALEKLKTVPFSGVKQFRLSKKQLEAVNADVSSGE